jgi:anaerobic magnesium-protoporphyrin IX monomethyl ester cyclase
MSKLDCVLVYPEPSLESPAKGPALSIFYPGAMLENKGYNVEYIDLRFEKQKVLENIIAECPLAVGISSMTGYQLIGAKKVIEFVKEYDKNIKTILGGPHVTIQKEKVLKEQKGIDYYIVGEGEIQLCNLMHCIKNNKKFDPKRYENIHVNLDAIPSPLTEKTKPYYKIANNANSIRVLTTRGCMYSCNFCYNQAVYNGKWKKMGIHIFEKEIENLNKEFDIKHIILGDDNIGNNKQRIKNIGDIMKRYDIKWHSSIRPEWVKHDMINILEKGGCDSLFLGIESGSERILTEVINKKLPRGLLDIRDCTKNLAKSTISGMYSFMCAIPTETNEELLESMNLADWIFKTDPNARLGFYVYAPYPGTKMYEMALATGFNEPRNWDEWSKVSLSESWGEEWENFYYMTGLHFRKDKTEQNFPGIRRDIIKLYEDLANLHWRNRTWKDFPGKNVKHLIIKERHRLN